MKNEKHKQKKTGEGSEWKRKGTIETKTKHPEEKIVHRAKISKFRATKERYSTR